MLSPKQKSLYWRTWSAVCKARGWKNSDSDRRYELHDAAGAKPSMTNFTNRDLDLFLTEAKRQMGANVTATTAAESGERKRLIWRIHEDAKKGGLDAAYLAKLSTDLTGLACWDELCIADLTNFRDAIHNRASTRLGSDTRTRPRRRMVLDPEKKFFPSPKPEPVPHHAEADPF